MTRPRLLRLAEPRFGDDALEAIGRVLATGNLTQGPVGRVRGGGRRLLRRASRRSPRRRRQRRSSWRWPRSASVPATRSRSPISPIRDGQRRPAARRPAAARRRRPGDLLRRRPGALEARADPRTKAAIAVDVFGLPADYRRSSRCSPTRDPARSAMRRALWAARSGSGATAVSASMSCFSFHPRKSLTTGEGGMVLTEDDALAAPTAPAAQPRRERGGFRATFVEPGFNYRLSDLNAALGLVQVPGFPATGRRRGSSPPRCARRLCGRPGLRRRRCPGLPHPYQSFSWSACDERARPRRDRRWGSGSAAWSRRSGPTRCTPSRASGALRHPAGRPARLTAGGAHVRAAPAPGHGGRRTSRSSRRARGRLQRALSDAAYQLTVRAKPSRDATPAARSRPPRARRRRRRGAGVRRPGAPARVDRMVGASERVEQRRTISFTEHSVAVPEVDRGRGASARPRGRASRDRVADVGHVPRLLAVAVDD